MRLYYGLVLNPGCTWMRPDLPLVYKTNYATALVLGGNPSGCLGDSGRAQRRAESDRPAVAWRNQGLGVAVDILAKVELALRPH